jgi:sulfur-oxidizing protein SoxB
VPDEKTGTADITIDYLWSMLPVNSNVKSAEAKGQQIINWLEDELEKTFAGDATKRFGGWFIRFSGMKVVFTINKPKGERIQSVIVNNRPLDPNRVYSLAACQRDGDPENVLCRITNTTDIHDYSILLHDIMESYLALHSPVAPIIEGRAIATDALPTLLTQVSEGVDYQFR